MENTQNKGFKQWFKDLDKKKVLSIVLNVLIWAFVIFSLLITVLVFTAQDNEDGVPSIFGKSLITISTKSMSPIYEEGDLVFMEKLDEQGLNNLKENDIITFRTPVDIDGDGMPGDINTHRIVEVLDGQNRYVTKGDYAPIKDNEGKNPYTVHRSDIIGICTEDGKLSGVGNIIKFLGSSLGFFLCIVLPLILFFLYELYNFITILVSERAKKAVAVAEVDEEEIKRRAIEEYLAAQAANKTADAEENGAKEENTEKSEE